MIDAKDLRSHPERYRTAAAQKRIDVDIDRLLELDEQHRRLLTDRQQLTAEKNQIGKQIGKLAGRMKKAAASEKPGLQEQMAKLQRRPAQLKEEEHALDLQIGQVEPEYQDLLMRVPQPPDEEVPVGEDDSQNVEIDRWGQIREFSFEPRDHVALGQSLGMIDIERGVKISGSRSYFLVGAGAMLHQAVLRLAMDLMIKKGFTPMSVPVMVRQPAMVGTGYFPLGREQTYALAQEQPEKFLVGTAEVSLTAYGMEEVLEENTLPRLYVAMSPCFRREAGTYGKDTAGLYRIHQFDKVEQVVICGNDVEESKHWHRKILENAQEMLKTLELPFRTVRVCSGELGQGQAAKYDIETWMPSRRSWGETHSASRFYDFQARRLGLRYRDEQGQKRFCHTLNNTVVASPRILIPIMELYQNEDGSMTIPTALQPYMHGLDRLEPDPAACESI